MGDIRIRRTPEELKLLLKAEAKQLGIDVRALELIKLWRPYETPHMGPQKDTKVASKGASQDTSSFQLPEWVPREAWGHYEEMRRKQRKPMTEAAKKTTVRKLEAMRSQGQNVGEVLEQSVERCWTGVFPVNEQKVAKPKQPDLERIQAALAAQRRLGENG